jgi:hypothetical protein
MQITTNENGKAIKELWLPGEGNAENTCYRVGKNGVLEIKLQATYHGDRDEMWAHVKQENAEVSVNLKQVTSIIWA